MNTSPFCIDPKVAQEFAHAAHDSIGQKRKYSGEPYHVHTDEVARLAEGAGVTLEGICAAHLHDVQEDVNCYPYNLTGIRERFGDRVAILVMQLTEVFTKEAFPDKNRKWRKRHEAIRLGNIHSEAKTIKCCDLIANTRDIVKQDPVFAVTYLREKREILDLMKSASSLSAYLAAVSVLKDGERELSV